MCLGKVRVEPGIEICILVCSGSLFLHTSSGALHVFSPTDTLYDLFKVINPRDSIIYLILYILFN